MEVRTSTENPYRYCWYGFGTVFQFQYQLGTVLRSGTVGAVLERSELFFSKISKNEPPCWLDR